MLKLRKLAKLHKLQTNNFTYNAIRNINYYTRTIRHPWRLDRNTNNTYKKELTMTLRELRPSNYSAINVTVEYLGRRYLITHCNDWFTAERVACDYQAKFPDACYFTSSKYDSTHIDGKAIDFRNHYAKEKLA